VVTKVLKWGNSQGLRLAKHVLERAHISVGDRVEVIAGEEEIVIKKATKRKFDLVEMVSRMPRNHKAKEERFGVSVGKEDW